jgi:bifunctional non-homologous end joining protein LigD
MPAEMAKPPLSQLRAAVAGAPLRKVDPGKLELQLAEARAAPFSREGWLFELKYDGFRVLAARESKGHRLLYRRGTEALPLYPEIAEALATLAGEAWVLDGELVTLDDQGRPVFQRLLKRSTLTRAGDVTRAAGDLPAVLFIFDILSFEGRDLRGLPLTERKRLLQLLIPNEGRVRRVDHVEREGEAFYAQVEKLGLEGMVAKRADSPYRPGRGPTWLKIARQHTGEFAVLGYADDWGALYLGVPDGDSFRFAGKVGSGFGPAQVKEAQAALEGARRPKPEVVGDYPRDKEAVWVEPRLTAHVRYKEWPEGMALRAPVFLGFREEAKPGPKLTNLNKVFFPEDRLTKGDLISYYREIAPWMLPYLRDRPVLLTRYPDGIHGKSFFQKNVPEYVGAAGHFVCNDEQTLVLYANLGSIPIHMGSSRVADLSRPDWCVVDLDPKKASFDKVVKLALALRKLCDRIELPTYVKSTGSSGLHVLIPLGGQVDHRGAITLAEVLSAILVRQLPEIATVERVIERRGDRVYLDCYQNGEGRLIVAPFAVRPLPTAPVSMPLRWSEVGKKLHPRQFTIKNARARMEKLPEDPLARVLTEKPDLAAAIDRLSRLG